MFPIGTILYVINAGSGARGVDSYIGEVTNFANVNGLYSTEDGFNIKVLMHKRELIYVDYPPSKFTNSIWRVSLQGKYIVCPHFDKQHKKIKEWFDSVMLLECLKNKESEINKDY